MTAPVYTLPVSGTDPKITTKQLLESSINAVISALFEEIATVTTGLNPRGGWDASSGVFPSGSVRGDYWIVSGAGTVDSQNFIVGDWLVALVTDASISVFDTNWFRADYSQVTPREYETISALALSDSLTDGSFYDVNVGSNGEPEIFQYDAASTATADGALIVDATGMGVGRLISTRKTHTTVPDLLTGDFRGYATYTAGDIVDAGGFRYQVATEASTDYHVITSGGVKLYVQPSENGYNVKAFGAVGDAVTDDTGAIQTAINAAANEKTLGVYFPSAHYIVSTLYDHYDVTNNPGFPSGSFLQGRISLVGEKATDMSQLLFVTSGYSGTLIETNSATGPALLCGNGNSASAITARRTHVKNLAFLGVCTGSVLELDGAPQHVEIGNCSIMNKGGVGGSAMYIHNGFYQSRLYDLDMASTGVGGNGMVCETASLVLFEMVNVTNCGDTAWKLGTVCPDADTSVFGTGNTFLNCQGRNSSNGLEIMGGRANTFQGWWLEQNEGDFDLKVHQNASQITFRGMYLTSTDLAIASAIIGGNGGVSYEDACRGIKMESIVFNFCGPTAAQAGVLKYGSCANLTLEKCSFKSNGGRGIIVDTTAGITPTEMSEADFDPVGASTAIGTNSRVVDQSGTFSPWLVRGCNVSGTITSDLDMSTWTHLPDNLSASTGVNINITLPTDTSQVIGKMLSVRKTLAGNTLTLTGTIQGAASISATADESITTVIAHNQIGLYGQLS